MIRSRAHILTRRTWQCATKCLTPPLRSHIRNLMSHAAYNSRKLGDSDGARNARHGRPSACGPRRAAGSCGDASQASIATCTGGATSLDWCPVCVTCANPFARRHPGSRDANYEANHLQRQLHQHMLGGLQHRSRLDSLHGLAFKSLLSVRCPSTNSCVQPLTCESTNQDPMLPHVRPSRRGETIQHVFAQIIWSTRRKIHTLQQSIYGSVQRTKRESETCSRKRTDISSRRLCHGRWKAQRR